MKLTLAIRHICPTLWNYSFVTDEYNTNHREEEQIYIDIAKI